MELRRTLPAFSLTTLALLGALSAPPLTAAEPAAAPPAGPPAGPAAEAVAMGRQLKAIEGSIDVACKWLGTQRNADGSYGRNPANNEPFPSAGLTAMALHALLSTHRNYQPGDGPFITAPADWLVKAQKESGAVVGADEKNANYETSVAVMALAQAAKFDPARYSPVVTKAAGYLKGCQYVPVEGDPKSGGVGYRTGDKNVDLPNTTLFLGALKYAGYAKDSKEFTNAVAFLERCQASAEVNKLDWAKTAKDGGGRYNEKGLTQDAGGTSTGALSYSLLTSYLTLELPANDPRMVAVQSYVAAHYSVEEHPGLASDGLFYYYSIMAKALQLRALAGGGNSVTTADGVAHRWAQDLSAKLITLQQKDGSFVNAKSGKYWESDPVLCTSYAILALDKCRLNLQSQLEAPK